MDDWNSPKLVPSNLDVISLYFISEVELRGYLLYEPLGGVESHFLVPCWLVGGFIGDVKFGLQAGTADAANQLSITNYWFAAIL